jgi:hypothetical protein
MQMWRDSIGTVPPFSSTAQPLLSTSQSAKAPTASGSEQRRPEVRQDSAPCLGIGQFGCRDGHGMSRNLSREASCRFGLRCVRNSSYGPQTV